MIPSPERVSRLRNAPLLFSAYLTADPDSLHVQTQVSARGGALEGLHFALGGKPGDVEEGGVESQEKVITTHSAGTGDGFKADGEIRCDQWHI